MTIPQSPVVKTKEGCFTRDETPEVYSRQTTISHWQLRDLVTCAEDGCIYTVHRSTVIKFDPFALKSTTVQSLDFQPTSMCYKDGYIATGGQQGQLRVAKIQPNGSATEVHRGDVSTSVNNALHIAPRPDGRVQLFVCNNDQSVRMYDLPTMEQTAQLRFDTAMNYCSVSPDGTEMLCVGDNNQMMIYHARESDWHKTHTFQEFRDAGMACAWNPSGTLISAVSQDGRCCVWDAHSHRLLARYRTEGACRDVKFSSGPMDLLAFSEHTTRCHLVDARMLTRKQVLYLDDDDTGEPNISGISFTPGGERLFVGTEHSLAAFSIDTVRRRTLGNGGLV
ncbi:unnamed protein product [Pedinophyceae sp. YPF-701]|nr:unnamed protein product [Pedinophyceae sp. YPF-701]